MALDEFSIRMKEARHMMGFSMQKLVDLAGGVVTKQSVSRYELGVMQPKKKAREALAEVLGVSVSYFQGDNLRIDLPLLRTTTGGKMTDEEFTVLEARITFWAERYFNKERKALGQVPAFVNPLKGFKVRTIDDAIRAADRLRQSWRCGDGPLPGLLRLMERKGLRILSTELPEGVLGAATRDEHEHPFIVLDMRRKRTNTERLRFTAAHELAHLLLTFPDDSEFSQEKRCNLFASFFLFPKSTFLEEFGSVPREQLHLEELIDLRELYGVSIASQVHEAWDLGLITRAHYDWWFNEMINPNILESNWGNYPYAETIGRERRLEVRGE